MKALVLTAYNELQLKEVPKPVPEEDEVLVRIKACAICGSDVHGYDGASGRRQPPIIMGHEAGGVIEQVGRAVQGYAVGDRVTFDSTVFCGNCWYCRHGMVNLCEKRRCSASPATNIPIRAQWRNMRQSRREPCFGYRMRSVSNRRRW